MRLTPTMAVIPALFLTGCLKTRADAKDYEQRQVTAQQVATSQRQATADAAGRLADVEEDLRALRGRVEVMEHKTGQGSQEADSVKKFAVDQTNETNRKMALLQESVANLEKMIFQLNAEMNALKAERAASIAQASAAQAANNAAAAAAAKKGNFEVAQDFFENKDWKKAILSFQKYRDENPNGKKMAEATYKIGVCFQELGMKDEAKTFFDEVIAKHPKSEDAKRAKTRLKILNKK